MFTVKIILISCFCCVVTACGSSKKPAGTRSSSMIVDDGISSPIATPVANTAVPVPAITAVTTAKIYNPLQQKYARYLNVSPDDITNLQLYGFIEKWLATPYLWGGTDKRGIDCSAFIQKLLEEVYSINLPRTSIEQFFANWIERFGSKKYLSEGDLIFFRTMDEKLVSHVGLYLNNRMFINSSSSKGVSIASLDDAYWKKRYIAAGRVDLVKLKNYKARLK